MLSLFRFKITAVINTLTPEQSKAPMNYPIPGRLHPTYDIESLPLYKNLSKPGFLTNGLNTTFKVVSILIG